MKNLELLKYILILYFGWLISILFITCLGLSILPHSVSPGQFLPPDPNLDFFKRWSNWDGGHFLGISTNGYLPQQVVFFPLYPILIKLLSFLFIPPLWSALLISSISTITALFFFYKLVLLDFNDSIAKNSLFLLLAFPTSFYLTAAYSESLFLSLTVAAFYFARTKNWLLAFYLAGLCSITRQIGLIVIFAITLEFLLKNNQTNFKNFFNNFLNRLTLYIFIINICLYFIPAVLMNFGPDMFLYIGSITTISGQLIYLNIILPILIFLRFILKNIDYQKILTPDFSYVLISITPLLGFLIFLQITQNDPFAFHTQEIHRQKKASFPWDAVINHFNYLKYVNIFQVGGSAYALFEFLFFLLFFITFFFSIKKLRISYLTYYLLALLIPIASGTLMSIHRYGLILFPFFIIIAGVKNEFFQKIWIYFSLTLLGFFSILYINSYWIS